MPHLYRTSTFYCLVNDGLALSGPAKDDRTVLQEAASILSSIFYPVLTLLRPSLFTPSFPDWLPLHTLYPTCAPISIETLAVHRILPTIR
jgi:hypothetical protein